jgi:nitrogen regulatory protein PII
MKRIELVVEPSALECFIETARGLNLPDFDVTEVRRATGSIVSKSQRYYRGREFVADFVERVKIDLNVADDAATRIVHELIGSVRPESIAILRLDRTAVVTDEAPAGSTHLAAVPSAPALAAVH